MAELALSAFGAGVAAVQTAQGLQKLADMFEEISHAADDIRYFHLETQNFIKVLDLFCNIVVESIEHLEKGRQGQRKDLIDSTVKMFDFARRDIESVAKRFVLDIDDVDSCFQRYAIQIRWYMKRNSITGLRFMPERVKSSANLLMTTTIYENLKRRIHELEKAQQEVPADMGIKMRYYTELVKREKTAARKAVKVMASFHMTHKGVEGFLHSDMQSFKDVEKAIQKQASAVAPKRRRRRTNNRNSRYEAIPLSNETTDGAGVGVLFSPNKERTLRRVKGNSLRSRSRERGRERTPSQAISAVVPTTVSITSTTIRH